MREILLVGSSRFPFSFPIDFLGMLAEKITNLNHMIIGYLTSYKCKQFAKHSNCNHVTPWNMCNILQGPYRPLLIPTIIKQTIVNQAIPVLHKH